MSRIKNIEKLSGILQPEDLSKLDAAAGVHQKQSNISFTITDLTGTTISVETEQGRTAGNFARYRTLIKRTHEVFDKFLPARFRLEVRPLEFVESPAAAVTPEWIGRQMLEKEVKIRQIAFDTDLERRDISGWVTGERQMSRIVKAMFYYYFKSL